MYTFLCTPQFWLTSPGVKTVTPKWSHIFPLEYSDFFQGAYCKEQLVCFSV